MIDVDKLLEFETQIDHRWIYIPQEIKTSIRQLCLEVKALRKLENLLQWCKDLDERAHGKDCEYWDILEDKPSGEKCECGLVDFKLVFKELDEARNG
jgi:hypothetical protein